MVFVLILGMPAPQKTIFSRLLKIGKVLLISIAVVLATLFIVPYLFPNFVGDKIKQWTNQTIKGRLDFTKARLSFFNHFPSLTLTLYDVSLKGSAPFAQDTLVSSKELALGINLKRLIFNKSVDINKIFLTEALINIEIDEKGAANYNIYQSAPAADTTKTDSSATSLKLEKIQIDNSHLLYNDRSLPMLIDARRFYYEGNGDLTKSIFDLTSHIQTDSLNFVFENEYYVNRKAINADLITRINTSTLALLFQKNDLLINRLPLQFSGKFDFLKNGYEMDFRILSKDAALDDVLTALPPEYLGWMQQTQLKGKVNLLTMLQGKYIAATGQKPDFHLAVSLRDGYVAHEKASLPATNLYTDIDIKVPNLDPEKLDARIDTISFNLAKDYMHGNLRVRGLTTPTLHLYSIAALDLQSLQQAFGLKGWDMKGRLDLQAQADGRYATKVIPVSLRKKDTVISSIPVFNINLKLQHGYAKYEKLPESIHDIEVSFRAFCPDSNFHHANIVLDTLQATALRNFIRGSAKVNTAADFPLEANLSGDVNLGDIQKIYPLDSMQLAGQLGFLLVSKGKYAPAKKIFPHTTAKFQLNSGFIQTKYYPHPIRDMKISATAVDNLGTLADLKVNISPASLAFEGKTLNITAALSHFDDLLYDVSLQGGFDIGKIYQVFAIKGMGVSGEIDVNAKFKGRQSDAMHARYARLQESGTLTVNNLQVSEEEFPKPFLIRKGLFSFRQDKMWFDKFNANYGHTDFVLNGFLENVMNYVLSPGAPLQGNFDLQSNYIDVNEFTAFAGNTSSATTAKKPVANGVVMIPKNLDLTLKAAVKKISYSGLDLDSFYGGVVIDTGSIRLSETGFGLIGCKVKMDGLYQNIGTNKANFEYHLSAEDFDIHRAYTDIQLFRDLATSASSAQGILSLDYSLKGRLNETMKPVTLLYPVVAFFP